MRIYKNELHNMSTACCLLIPTYTKKAGKEIKEYNEYSDIIFLCSFKQKGGTESVKDGIYTIEDTAEVFTFFDPNIKSNCRIRNLVNDGVYDIIGEPENIDQRNQFIKFKVKRTKCSV